MEKREKGSERMMERLRENCKQITINICKNSHNRQTGESLVMELDTRKGTQCNTQIPDESMSEASSTPLSEETDVKEKWTPTAEENYTKSRNPQISEENTAFINDSIQRYIKTNEAMNNMLSQSYRELATLQRDYAIQEVNWHTIFCCLYILRMLDHHFEVFNLFKKWF